MQNKRLYFKENVTKTWLASNNFRYDRSLSDEENNVYTYRFPVHQHNNIATLECELVIFMDGNSQSMVKVNVYESNTKEQYNPFYYIEFGKYDTLLKFVNKKIHEKLKELGIKKGRSK